MNTIIIKINISNGFIF